MYDPEPNMPSRGSITMTCPAARNGSSIDRRHRALPSSVLIFLLLLVGTLAQPIQAQDVSRRDDAYHYALFADGQHDESYAEWWYFNLFDSVQDVQLAVTYSILDPANRSGYGLAALAAIAYTPHGQFTEIASHPPAAFHASDEQADVLIVGDSPPALNYIQVLSDNVYRVVGSISQEHSISWDLWYVRRRASWLGGDRERVGLLPWEHMSWLQYMPGASVSGVVTIDGRKYEFGNASGYHDHNWGEWLPFTVTWNWAQYFEPGLDFAIGDFRNSDAGSVTINVLGRRTVFTKDQYTLTHTSWSYDAVNGLWFPVTTWLYARNDATVLVVRLRARRTLPILPPPEIPLPLVPVIYEQTAGFLGQLWRKDQAGAWNLVRSFAGGGFKEYTDVTWPRPR